MENICKKNILLIDDDDDELEIFTSSLDDLKISYNCSCARSTQQAMKMLMNMVPDIIFLDVNMPGANGLKCLRDIRQIKTLENVPVIMYSTCMDESTSKAALNSGAAACIKKTSSIKSLTGILKEIFGRYLVFNPYPGSLKPLAGGVTFLWGKSN